MFDKTAYAVCMTLAIGSAILGWNYWCFIDCGEPQKAQMLIDIAFVEIGVMTMTTLAASGYSELAVEG